MGKKKSKQTGKFIVFEGIDGSGTTTQNRLLTRYLTERNYPVCTTCEPTSGPVGLLLRLLLSNRLTFPSQTLDNKMLSGGAMALLFAADRLDHIQDLIAPKLQNGIWVICDRYYLSSYAYQMGQDSSRLPWLQTINNKALQPDLIIFVRTDQAICAERRQLRNPWQQDLYENNEILTQVAKNYEIAIAMLKQQGVCIETVDGNLDEQSVFRQVQQLVKSFFHDVVTETV